MSSNKLNSDEKYWKGSYETTFKKLFANHKSHLTTTDIKTKQNFQMKYGILSQQITTQKLLGKSYEDAPL